MRIGQNVTHRTDGRWEARYIKGRSTEGKTAYGFCYGKTRDEAIQKCEDAKRLLKNATIESPKPFRDVYAIWVNTEHVDNSAKLAETLLLPAIGDLLVTELTDKNLSSLLKTIKASHSVADTKKCFDLLSETLNFALHEDYLITSPIGVETMKYQSGRKAKTTRGNLPISEQEYLTTEQAKTLEQAILNGLNGKRPGACIGLFLCLHLGLTYAEVGALQLQDVDFERRDLRINKVVVKQKKTNSCADAHEMTPIEERILPLPQFVHAFLLQIKDHYHESSSFLACNKNGKQCLMSEYLRELKQINEEHPDLPKLDFKILRDSFIVRCVQNELDVFTIAKILGLTDASDLLGQYGAFFKTETENLCRMESYAVGTRSENNESQKMNLLILGAGGYGHTVKEIAEKIGIFDQISFLDDNPTVTEAIDIFENAPRYKNQFPCAYPAIGNCKRRAELIDFLEKESFQVPRLIHPSVTVSPSSTVESGVIIEANATINAMAQIKKGCIISSNALIDRGAFVSEAVHVDSSATVAKDCFVPPLTKIDSGTVYTGEKE